MRIQSSRPLPAGHEIWEYNRPTHSEARLHRYLGICQGTLSSHASDKEYICKYIQFKTHEPRSARCSPRPPGLRHLRVKRREKLAISTFMVPRAWIFLAFTAASENLAPSLRLVSGAAVSASEHWPRSGLSRWWDEVKHAREVPFGPAMQP